MSAAIRVAASSPSPACVLDTRCAYLFANDGWLSHAVAHGTLRAETLVGSSVYDGLDGDDVRRSWRAALHDVLAGTAPWRSIAGEQNTTTVARLTATRVEPIVAAHGVLGLVLVRSVVRERPISDLYVVSQRSSDAYEQADGRVTQCPCCRRARDRTDPTAWEIVPGWVAAPPPAARWIPCDFCAELHLALNDAAA